MGFYRPIFFKLEKNVHYIVPVLTSIKETRCIHHQKILSKSWGRTHFAVFGNATVWNIWGECRLTQDRISGRTFTGARLSNKDYTNLILHKVIVYKELKTCNTGFSTGHNKVNVFNQFWCYIKQIVHYTNVNACFTFTSWRLMVQRKVTFLFKWISWVRIYLVIQQRVIRWERKSTYNTRSI